MSERAAGQHPPKRQPECTSSRLREHPQEFPHESSPADDPQLAPACITLLYESRDGKLCLFQDAQGHLTAVRSAQLA